MTLTELTATLGAIDAKLALRLVVDAPEGTLSDVIKNALATHKPSLLMGLAREAQWTILSEQRWGPALPGACPDDTPDDYAALEREAIQAEHLDWPHSSS